MEALDALTSVLCDPEGVVCITGSPADREIVQRSLATLRARVEKLESVREAAKGSEQITRVVLNALHRDWSESGKREEMYKELREVFGNVCAALSECEEV
jgi:hypothetical protein